MSVKKSFITVPLDKLIPYENNPRINEPAIPDTVESIKQCENLDPIEVDEGFVILSGHTRLLALKQLGYTETEVVQYEGLTEEQKRKYRILANKTGEAAEWDFSKLEQELADLDFSDFSFDFDGIEEQLQDVEVKEDEPPEPPEEPKAKVWDLWQLGRWVYCKKCGKKHYIS
jgi:site-specific DNA-methyltransferase (adenine-specific)